MALSTQRVPHSTAWRIPHNAPGTSLLAPGTRSKRSACRTMAPCCVQCKAHRPPGPLPPLAPQPDPLGNAGTCLLFVAAAWRPSTFALDRSLAVTCAGRDV
eukprot:365086-Chlamydomonas_euryale.AAC.4